MRSPLFAKKFRMRTRRLLGVAVTLLVGMGIAPDAAFADEDGQPLGAYTFAGIADVDHDSFGDIVTRENSTGKLWLYRGYFDDQIYFTSDPTLPPPLQYPYPRVQIGSGWGGYTFAGVSDYDGDGTPDIVAREDSTGKLWLYRGHWDPNSISYNPNLPPPVQYTLLPRVQIGIGWGGYTFAGVAKWNSDSYGDIVVRENSTGKLWLYPGYFDPNAISYNPNVPLVMISPYPRQDLGYGDWRGYTFAGFPSYEVAATTYVMARENSTGKLWFYSRCYDPNRPQPQPIALCSRTQIGSGWGGYTFAGVARYNRDSVPDIVVRENSTGKLWLYLRYQSDAPEGGFLPRRAQIGSGW